MLIYSPYNTVSVIVFMFVLNLDTSHFGKLEFSFWLIHVHVNISLCEAHINIAVWTGNHPYK